MRAKEGVGVAIQGNGLDAVIQTAGAGGLLPPDRQAFANP